MSPARAPSIMKMEPSGPAAVAQSVGRATDAPNQPERACFKEGLMISRKFAAIAAALSMMVGSSAAIAQNARPLSVANSPAMRASAATADESDMSRRGYGIYIVGALAIAALIYGIIQLTDNDDPASP
jgi:hypothetical protein